MTDYVVRFRNDPEQFLRVASVDMEPLTTPSVCDMQQGPIRVNPVPPTLDLTAAEGTGNPPAWIEGTIVNLTATVTNDTNAGDVTNVRDILGVANTSWGTDAGPVTQGNSVTIASTYTVQQEDVDAGQFTVDVQFGGDINGNTIGSNTVTLTIEPGGLGGI